MATTHVFWAYANKSYCHLPDLPSEKHPTNKLAPVILGLTHLKYITLTRLNHPKLFIVFTISIEVHYDDAVALTLQTYEQTQTHQI